MKVQCIKTDYWPDSYEHVHLEGFITVGRIYDVLPSDEENPSPKCRNYWMIAIIDDRGNRHDIGEECFIPLRDINLDRLLN